MANRDAPAAGRLGDIGICALPAIGEARDSTDIFGCSPARHDGHSANDLHLLCVFRSSSATAWSRRYGHSRPAHRLYLVLPRRADHLDRRERTSRHCHFAASDDGHAARDDNCSCVGARLRQCAKSSSPADRLLPIAHRSCHRSRPDASRSSAYALRVSKISIAGRARPLRAPSPGASFFGAFGRGAPCTWALLNGRHRKPCT